MTIEGKIELAGSSQTLAWTDLRKFIDGYYAELSYVYESQELFYRIVTEVSGGFHRQSFLYKDMGSDQIDFENNFRDLRPRLTSEYLTSASTDVPLRIITGALSPGNLTLSDSINWATAQVFIDYIVVTTASNNWDLWTSEDNSFDTENPTTKQLVSGGSGDMTINVGLLNTSDTTDLYMIYGDNSGSNTAKFYVVGTSKVRDP